jgi:hypothetical protein
VGKANHASLGELYPRACDTWQQGKSHPNPNLARTDQKTAAYPNTSVFSIFFLQIRKIA